MGKVETSVERLLAEWEREGRFPYDPNVLVRLRAAIEADRRAALRSDSPESGGRQFVFDLIQPRNIAMYGPDEDGFWCVRRMDVVALIGDALDSRPASTGGERDEPDGRVAVNVEDNVLSVRNLRGQNRTLWVML